MNSNCERIEENKVKLNVEVEADRVEEGLQKAYEKVKKKVSVPGFRKGKVPRKILESKYGPEVLYEDALEYIIPHAYREAVEENEIEPVDEPEIDIEQMEKGKPLKFTATVVVKPEVKLGEYKGVEVEKEKVEITEEEVEEELRQMQEKHAEFEKVEDGHAEKGDRLVIDFVGYKYGEKFEGGEAENYNIELGAGQLVPGFEDELEGLKPGDDKEISITMPEDYGNKDLAGEDVKFEVKVKEIKKKKLLPLDDEFAKDVSDFDTLEELKEDTRKKLEEAAEQRAQNSVQEQVIAKVAENGEVDIPEAMIDQEAERMINEFEQNLRAQGLELEKYYELAGTDRESMKQQFWAGAEGRAKTQQVLEAIVEEEGITAGDDEVTEEINRIAEAYDQDPEQIEKVMEAQGQLKMLKKELALRKAIDFLEENANVKIVDPEEKEAEEIGESKEEEEKEEHGEDQDKKGKNEEEGKEESAKESNLE